MIIDVLRYIKRLLNKRAVYFHDLVKMIDKIELKVIMLKKKKRRKKSKKKDKGKPLSSDIIAINFMAAIDLVIKTKLVDPFDKNSFESCKKSNGR